MSMGGDDGPARGFDCVSRLKWEVAGRVESISVVEESQQRGPLAIEKGKKTGGLANCLASWVMV